MKSVLSLALVSLGLGAGFVAGCGDAGPKGDEEDPLGESELDDKADSLRSPTNHGVIPFGDEQSASISGAKGFHAWTFTLHGDADVQLFTSSAGSGNVDTVLYLYKKKSATSWGSYIARNDDDGASVFSMLDKHLTAGEYRAIVKGHSAATRGKFGLEVDCSGAGCTAAPPTCLFGEQFNQLDSIAGLTVSSRSVVRAPSDLSPLDQQRAILAVQQSAHTDVMTIEQAFDAVDQGEINVVRLYEPAAARTYTAFEYGAGDNSYGAIFYWNTTQMVTKIHDGDYEACNVHAQTCLLGSNYYDFRTNPAFTKSNARVVTAASQLTGTAAQQALAAIQVAYTDATTLANGLTLIDSSRLNVATYTHQNGTVVNAYEYGAGDNSYGALFVGNTLTKAAEINDLDFYGCSLLQ